MMTMTEKLQGIMNTLIARMTIYEPADFSYSAWLKVSKDAKNFVESIDYCVIIELLIKDPRKRMTLEQTLEHPWLTRGDADIRNLRRNSVSDRISKFKMFSHAQPDSPKIIEEIEKITKEAI